MTDLLAALAVIAVNVLAAAAAVAVYAIYRAMRTDERYRVVVDLVEAAEQMYGDLAGHERKALVMKQLASMFPSLDAELLATLVEAAVYRLNQAQRARGE